MQPLSGQRDRPCYDLRLPQRSLRSYHSLALYPIRFVQRTYHERHTQPIYYTVLRVVFPIGIASLLVLNPEVILAVVLFLFIIPEYFVPLILLVFFVKSFRALLPYVDRMTGAFCLFHSLSSPTSPSSNLRRRLGIVAVVIMVLTLFTWADYLIVNASHTLEIDFDKYIYQSGETSMITITRGGLLEGSPSLKCVYKDNLKPALKQSRSSFDAHDEDIASLRYFIIIKNPVDFDAVDANKPESGRNEEIVEVIASHNKAGLFGQTKVALKTYLKILPTP